MSDDTKSPHEETHGLNRRGSHPVTESRIADTRNRAEQYPQGGKEDSLRYQQMRARTQLLF
ncbi:hypothetical protein KB219_22000, partial [Pseudomonas aeruginosa]|nr:hypothetical protein [Pseudomonas aeruginosa]